MYDHNMLDEIVTMSPTHNVCSLDEIVQLSSHT